MAQLKDTVIHGSLHVENDIYVGENGINKLVDLIYPIGSIYISVADTSPETLIGGTWERFGTGKTLVSIDENDTDFAMAEATGGAKGAWYHSHGGNTSTNGAHVHNMKGYGAKLGTGSTGWRIGAGGGEVGTGMVIENGNHSHTINATGDSNNQLDASKANMPPYINVYMWKRTA